MNRNIRIFIAMAALLLTVNARAAVTATVDRADVEINESFTLKILVDTGADIEPDVSALETDFHVGQRSTVSNTTIVNSQISRSVTWTYMLMAKRAGNLIIPPVIVGNEQSNPLHIVVTPQSNALPGEADIFVATEVDYTVSYVQAQVLYTVKVYRSVATRQPRLSEPSFDGVEVLVELAGDERTYESILSGKSYNVVERVYALFPQESGELTISPARFEARVLRGGRITGRKVFESESQTVVVNPIPPPPPEYPGAEWLPAKSLELSESWSREADNLPVGEPITRHVTISALGQLSTQIPVIDPVATDGLKIYPDKPELNVFAEPDGIRAVRKDQYALIGIEAGVVELPALILPWWSIDRGEWQVASLPPRSLTILPSGEAMATIPTVEPEIQLPFETETIIVESSFWRRISEGLVALWMLTVFAWWWSNRPEKKRKESEPPPIYKQQAKFLKAARRAALAEDDATVKAALLSWGRLQWPDDWPRSIGELAERVNDPLASELNALCSSTYGPNRESWNGKALAKALRSFAVRSDEDEKTDDRELPPLMPTSAV